jgi:hypothetical protein
MNSVCIVGAGPAGVFSALTIRDYFNADVVVFDEKEPLETLIPTGGGRCNFSYFETDIKSFADYYPRGAKFLLSGLYTFGMNDTVDYFESIGIKSYVQNDNRIFPISDSSKVMAKILCKRAEILGIIFQKERVRDIVKKGKKFIIYTTKHQYTFDKVIIATGGKSFELAEKLGHSIVLPQKTLAPLEIEEIEYYNLSGLSLQGVWIKVFFENKKILNVAGDMLFTKNSISGPVIFKISSLCAYDKYTKENPLELQINIAKQNLQYLTNYINEYRDSNPRTTIRNAFNSFCPKSLFDIILRLNNIDETKQIAQMTKKEKDIILENLTSLKLHVNRQVPNSGIVTAGGVNTKEINSKTMESKIEEGIFFAGETINIDGFTGGFNLQNCWTTGRIAGMNVLANE